MIGLLRGRIVESSADGTLITDVGGVGYEVLAPLGTAGRLSADGDGAQTLYIHTHVREDAFILFGFATKLERSAFRTLLSVAKVGPKLALGVLGAMTVEELAHAVATDASKELSKVPGIGKKTAERIVLELSGKLDMALVGASSARAGRSGGLAPPGQTAMVLDALVRMGFRPSEAERAVAEVVDHDRPLQELIREALSVLAP